MSIHPLRSLIHKTGWDVRRHRHTPHPMSWLKNMGISTIIDVGANTGQFAREIREILPGVQIYSFEPLQSCYRTLVKNMAHDAHFKAYNCALGETEERRTIHVSGYSPSSSLLPMTRVHSDAFPVTRQTTEETIEVKRMDDVFRDLPLAQHILIKIDVQGFEDKVLKGGRHILQKTRVVILETSFVALYEGQSLFAELHAHMTELGFTYKGSLHTKHHPLTGENLFEDSIFIR